MSTNKKYDFIYFSNTTGEPKLREHKVLQKPAEMIDKDEEIILYDWMDISPSNEGFWGYVYDKDAKPRILTFCEIKEKIIEWVGEYDHSYRKMSYDEIASKLDHGEIKVEFRHKENSYNPCDGLEWRIFYIARKPCSNPHYEFEMKDYNKSLKEHEQFEKEQGIFRKLKESWIKTQYELND